MYFKSENELEEFFIEQDIFPLNAIKINGENDIEVILIGKNNFEKMNQFLKNNKMKTVLYNTYSVNEDENIISEELLESVIGKETLEFLKEEGFMKKLYVEIEKHNSRVNKKLDLLQTYEVSAFMDNVTYRVIINNFELNRAEEMLDELLTNSEIDIEKYKTMFDEQNREERRNTWIDEVKQKDKEIEKLVEDNFDMLNTLTNKPVKISYIQRKAVERGIQVHGHEISTFLDIFTAEKKLSNK